MSSYFCGEILSHGGQKLNRFHQLSSKNALAVVLCVIFLSSCATFKKFTADESVPKEKYDDLLKKYKDLVSTKGPDLPNNGTNFVPVENKEMLLDLKNRLLNSKMEFNNVQDYNPSRVSKDLNLLYQAYDKFNQKKFGDVIILLKELEASQVFQVRAQAKYLFGITMFEQGEFDLAMQIFEDVMVKMRSSVFGLLSLNKLLACTERLGLKKKNEYYTQIFSRFMK